MAKDQGHAKYRLQVFDCFVGTGVPGQGLGLSAEQRRERGGVQTEIFD